jgi:dTDP-4-dehydrorhamnose reductase
LSGRRVLITGGGGQLAADLEALLDGEVRAPRHAELDITNDAAVAREFAEFGPELVFNCAAFHDVDGCETEVDRAFEVNATAVRLLAARCAESGAKLVHLSTNYVFAGDREEPYAEDDLPSARSAYAISKVAGEYAALAYAPAAMVVRTAGLYGLCGSSSSGANFVARMLSRGRAGERIRMVSDQRLSPTFTADLATALLQAVNVGAEGILHLTNSGACSWFEFTQAIFELAEIAVSIEPVSKAGGPGLADRPLNGVLSRPAADAAGLTPLRHWRDALNDYMRQAEMVPAAQSA